MHIYHYLCVFGFGIKTVHSSVGAYEYPVSNSFNNPLAYLGHLFFLLRSHLSYYIIHLFPTLEIIAYAQTYSCIFLGAYEFVYVLQAVMSAVASFLAHPYAPEWKVQVVTDDQKALFCDRKFLKPVADGVSAQVHIRGRLEKIDSPSLDAEDGYVTVPSCFKNSIGRLCPGVQYHKTHIVSGGSVLRTDIAKSHYKIVLTSHNL